MNNVVAFDPRFVVLTGDLATGVLLSQLLYWFKPSKNGGTKLTIERGGKLWLAKSRNQLQAETGLTDWKLRASLARLRKAGLIESEVHLFNNKTTSHFHLHVGKLETLLVAVDADALPSRPAVIRTHNHSGGSTNSGCEVPSQPYKEAETTAETTAEVALCAADAHATTAEKQVEVVTKKDPVQGKSNVIQVNFGGTMPTLDEVLKQHTESISQKNDEKRYVGPKALAILWKKSVGAESEEFVKEPTGQEIGQLRQFAEKVGIDADRVLSWAVCNWSEFIFECCSSYGLSASPSRPVIGWMLKYHDVAVQMRSKEESVQSIARESKVHGAPVHAPPPTVHPPSTEVASADKVAAALAKFKGKAG